MQKIALRYHRFSDKDQSHGSLERQDIITLHWCQSNNILVQDTFNDDGYSAKNFDRPDIKKLFEFIKDQKGKIDYLVVAELTRFSRELGDAVNMVTNIQKLYGIRIVSSARNSVYDVTDATSFFMMSIEFTMGKTENLQRESNINGGIYTAKKEGRYIGSRPPFGYTKTGEGKNKKLEIVPAEAAVIRFIFQSFLQQLPLNEIKKQAWAMGFRKAGRSAVQDVLDNPLYHGQQRVKAWKDQPGGIFPAAHEQIIDSITWHEVQQRLHAPKKKGVTLTDNMPLRGVLHCHCGQLLTGAPSRSRNGNYYYYYKCNRQSSHNNISVIKAHTQLQDVLQHLSIPGWMVTAVKDESRKLLAEEEKAAKQELIKLRRELQQGEEDLQSLEQKWIRNQVQVETYQRWFTHHTGNRTYLKAKIDSLSRGQDEMDMLLQDNLYQLTDMEFLYTAASTPAKQELLRKVFDNSLSYRSGIYRTANLMNIFRHNLLILREKKLLLLEEKPVFHGENRSGGPQQTTIEPLHDLLQFIRTIKVA